VRADALEHRPKPGGFGPENGIKSNGKKIRHAKPFKDLKVFGTGAYSTSTMIKQKLKFRIGTGCGFNWQN